MSAHAATVIWERGGANFADGKYSRAHRWQFDGGLEIAASASPSVVRAPLSVAAAVDPEEAFVASLASCHMLWFLSIAADRGFVVESYRDDALGMMSRNASGKMAITRVTLRPSVQFAGDRRPTDAEINGMHHAAHEECFIANSVTSEIVCEPVGI